MSGFYLMETFFYIHLLYDILMNKTIFVMLAIVAATSLVVSMSAPAFAVSQSISQGMAQGGNAQLGALNFGNIGVQAGVNAQCVLLTACFG